MYPPIPHPNPILPHPNPLLFFIYFFSMVLLRGLMNLIFLAVFRVRGLVGDAPAVKDDEYVL